MKKLILITLVNTVVVANALALGITKSEIPYNNRLQTKTEGSVIVNTSAEKRMITKKFFGADTNGFAKLPAAQNVVPMNLGYTKFGGNLHSVYNWKNNMYKDAGFGISEVYSPLLNRINIAKSDYKSTPMFQVNMLGVQPEMDSTGKLTMARTADAAHAGNAIKYLNGQSTLNVTNVLMGNEPFGEVSFGEKSPSADEYIAKYIKYAISIRDAQVAIGGNANDIKLWGPEISTGWSAWNTNHPNDCVTNSVAVAGQTCSYGNGQFSEFIPYFLSRLANAEKDSSINPKGYKLLDVLTWHYYPLFRKFSDQNSIIIDPTGQQNVSAMLQSVNLWNNSSYVNKYDNASPKNVTPDIINKFSCWRDQFYPAAQLAVTEFAVDSESGVRYHEILRPLYLADLVGRLAEGGVDTFVNSFLQNETAGAKWGMLDGNNRTDLYYMFTMFSRNFLGKVVSTSDSFGDKVNSYAVKTATGVNVFIVNKDTLSHTTTIEVNGNLTELSLAAWSLSVVTIPNDKSNILVQTFGASEMGVPVVGMPAAEMADSVTRGSCVSVPVPGIPVSIK